MANHTLGEKIMALRQKQRLSQETFGEKIGVSRQAVSKWETGQALPDIDKILAMSELFGVSTDYPLKEDEPQASQSESEETEATDSSDEEEQNAAGTTSLGSLWQSFRRLEFKSKTTVGGIPLVHITAGRAKGIFAVGLMATGVVSFGLLSIGLLSLGIVSLGLLAIGNFALGGLSVGGISAGIFALGGVAFGVFTIGGVAFGVFTIGGVSIGVYSMGGCAIASKIAFGGYARGFIAIGDKTSGTYTWHVTDSIPEQVKQEIYRTIQRELPNTPKFIAEFFR